jgi:predicted ABC-type ATPase
MSDSRKIVILAGPNGAGKTTFAREFLLHEGNCPIFVNADLIASGLSPFRPEVTALRAGRLMIEEIRGHARAGRSFAFETTLSGLAYARLIPHWRRQGYRVKLIHLQLASVDLALSRVAARPAGRPRSAGQCGGAAFRRRLAQLRASLQAVGRWLGFVRQFRRRSSPGGGGGKAMKQKRSASIDPYLAGALPALKRAAAAARRLSIETGTPFYVLENGRVVDRNATRSRRRVGRPAKSGRRRLHRAE